MCGELNEFWHITVYDVQHLRHQTLLVLWVAPPDLNFYILRLTTILILWVTYLE